jgi:GH15 family glucan-1,4-alpha-glucosidase
MLLKALTFAPTGGIVAAPTTSLPEQIGGSRNWDYRFCWLRDATLTLLALMNAGYRDEGASVARLAPSGRRRLPRPDPDDVRAWRRAPVARVGHRLAPGYAESRPVRIGNAAHKQLQLDVFGEVSDALHQARLGGIAPDSFEWPFQKELLAHLERSGRSPMRASGKYAAVRSISPSRR